MRDHDQRGHLASNVVRFERKHRPLKGVIRVWWISEFVRVSHAPQPWGGSALIFVENMSKVTPYPPRGRAASTFGTAGREQSINTWRGILNPVIAYQRREPFDRVLWVVKFGAQWGWQSRETRGARRSWAARFIFFLLWLNFTRVTKSRWLCCLIPAIGAIHPP